MKRMAWKGLAAGLLILAASCSGGSGSAGGSMFIRSCSLGCNQGQGGQQVSCGVINTFKNQDLSLIFSQPVDFASVSKASFQVVNVQTGQVPNGSFLIDPLNASRLIFRPELSFDPVGNPVFGFEDGESYSVIIPGSAQGDTGALIRSTSGNANTSRMTCTITTDQGTSDPVPGPATVSGFVDLVDVPTGALVPGQPADGAVNVSIGTKITLVFNDLMNISTLVVPQTGFAPFLKVRVDPDGDLNDPSDQVDLAGSYLFDVDLNTLQTTVVFTPSLPLPSAGSKVDKRKIVVQVQPGIKDLAGVDLGNPGPIAFTTEQLSFTPQTLTESFDDTSNLDDTESGANMWNVPSPTTGSMVGIGLGGGSGRLGPLNVAQGQVVDLTTSPTFARGGFRILATPEQGTSFDIDGQSFTYCQLPVQFPCPPTGSTAIPFEIQFDERHLIAESTVNVLNAQVWSIPVTWSYRLLDPVNEVYEVFATADNPGPGGNGLTMGPASPADRIDFLDSVTSGGSDGQVFPAGNLLDNFDFQANPGMTPPDITISDGIFEFSSLNIEPGGVLRIRGDNPARLYVRGRATVNTGAIIDIAGESPGIHLSNSPDGQAGGLGGPNGGAGGKGGDRHDNTGSMGTFGLLTIPITLTYNTAGIENPGAFINGRPGEGVGQSGTAAAGRGGSHWPNLLPPNILALNDLGANGSGPLGPCRSHQVAGPGSGGAYASDGTVGNPEPLAVGLEMDDQGRLNLPDLNGDMIEDLTPAGDSSQAGVEPAGQPTVVRRLDPDLGNLRGGAGGGGGGMSLLWTQTNAASSPCTTVGVDNISAHHSQSGAAGGGAGGAGLIQSGNTTTLNGQIDASGGNGGFAPMTFANSPVASAAAPGGGASGGAVNIQAPTIIFGSSAATISVAGGVGGLSTSPQAPSIGGDGGHGLIRLENGANDLDVNNLFTIFEPQIAPPVGQNYTEVMSVGKFLLKRTLPRSFQGAQSCWNRPAGNFFALTFDADDFTDPQNPIFGWNMNIVMDFGSGPVELPYRGDNGVTAMSLQDTWGELLNRDLMVGEVGAPLVIRFQGAKSSTTINDFCNVPLSGPTSTIQQGSLTPWVRHPNELNAFNPPPDMIRFVIIYDAFSDDLFDIRGVADITINSVPD